MRDAGMVVFGALLVGVSACAPAATPAAAPGPLPTVTETVTVTEPAPPVPTVTETITARPRPAPTVTETVTETQTVTETETVTEPAAPSSDDSYSGDFFGDATTDQFSFTNVDVQEDALGDFEVNARVTNDGSSVDSAAFTVTLLDSSGGVVATGSASVSDFGSGETKTAQFISADDYTSDYDDLEFQLEYAF